MTGVAVCIMESAGVVDFRKIMSPRDRVGARDLSEDAAMRLFGGVCLKKGSGNAQLELSTELQ